MANICNYSVSVCGPTAALDELKSLLVADSELLRGQGKQPDEWLVHFDTPTWGCTEQGFAYLDGNPSAPPPFHREDGLLRFSGQSKWTPPIEWMQRASERFPELEFSVSSTCESEHYEWWVAKAGEPELREERIYDVSRDATLYLMRGGRVIVDSAGIPVDDVLHDTSLLATSEAYRIAVTERLMVFEQYLAATRSEGESELRDTLGGRLTANDEQLDEAIAQFRAEKCDPRDDAEREQLVANTKKHRRRAREALRNPLPVVQPLRSQPEPEGKDFIALLRAMK